MFQNSPVKVVESPMWILTYSVIVIGLILSLYSVVKINKSNKYLIDEKSNTIHDFKESINKEKEKQLKRSGQIVVKRKFGWMYSPDKLENWLEEMEMQGYNLYRVSKTGTAFYFLIGIPRKVSYAIDYQTFSNESYYDMHKEVGWNKMFISPWSFQNWTIWSQEYKEGEERPQLYSDKSNHLKHARKIAITNTIMFLPLIIIYILNIRYMLDGLFTNDNTSLNIFNVIIFFICILFFGALTLRTWLYYMRLKMRYNF